MDNLMQEIRVSTKIALEEDIGDGDITSIASIPENSISKARIISKETGIISGMLPVKHILDKYSLLKYNILKDDGQPVNPGDIIIELQGLCQEILKLERTLLNYLQHLSGIATFTNKFVEIAKQHSVKIFDTRKTLPGLRYLQKKAVKDGGGENHRTGLFDAVLIKENHIQTVGSVSKAIKTIKKNTTYRSLKKTSKMFLEIEVETFEQAKEACAEKPDIILLDNMTDAVTKKTIQFIKANHPKILTEISGGINLKDIEKKAKLKPDRISIGKITHSAPSLDISLLIS
jgi:nicotinate-nucleotide pyrophosphorylase (carboxylating)